MNSNFSQAGSLMAFLVTALVSFGQQPVSYTINEKNNLPAYETYQVIQDGQGYMYIGCSAGLFRYDGFHYTPIPGKHQNSRAISHLQLDKSGAIWCQNFAGQIYTVVNDSLKLIKDYSSDGISFPPFALTETTLWVFLKKGMVKAVEGHDDEIIPYPDNEWQVTSVVAQSEGSLFCTVFGRGLYRYDVSAKRFEMVSQESFYKERCLAGVRGDTITVVGEQRDSKRYSFHKRKANLSIQLTKTTTELNTETVYQWKIYEEGNWLCTSNGAFLYTGNEFKLKHHLFAGEDVSSVYQDKEGNFWFTTLAGFIKVVPSLNLYALTNTSTTAPLNATACFTSVSGTKFMGTLSGEIFRINNRGQLIELAGEKKEIYRRVTRILPYRDLLLVSRGSLSIIEKSGQETIYKFAYIRDMALAGNLLYIINSSDFGVFNLETRKYTTIKSGSFRKLSVDEESGQIAITGNSGVFLYDGEKFQDVLYKQKPIYCSDVQFGSGVLWLATLDNGVMGFANNEWRYHFQPSELRGNSVSNVLVHDSSLYVTSEAGIQIWNIKTREHHFIGKRLHIDFAGINDLAIVRDTAYVSTQRGYYYFPVKAILYRSTPPNITLTSIANNGRLIDPTAQHSFAYNLNTVGISFKSISYRSLGAISYRYRLSGYSKDWMTLSGSTDQIVFESLRPSQYHFEVVAVDGDGVSSATPATFSFTILPPFWQRAWFIILFLVFFSGMIVLIFMRRIRRIRKQNLQQYRHIQSQLTALKAQMNPHFIHNALNSIQDLIIKHDIENSNQYLVKFSMLMRKVLEVSEKDFITVAEEAEILELYLGLEKLRFGSEFFYQIKMGDSIESDNTFIPPLLLQPFVENAIKHGLLHKKGERKLTVEFEKKDKIVCTITDNGIGRKRSGEINSRNTRIGTSFATKATEKRINLLRESSQHALDINIIDLYDGTTPTGTQVVITMDEKPFVN